MWHLSNMRLWRRRSSWSSNSASVVTAIVLGLLILIPAARGQSKPESPPPGAPAPSADPSIFQMREIGRLFSQGQYDAAATKVDEFFSRSSLTDENFVVLLYKAESQYRLGRIEDAIRSYQRVMPFVEKLNNVAQRQFVLVFFRLGSLYGAKAEYDVAIRYVEAGLVREPQNVFYQLLLGELFKDRGEPDRALKHFTELAASNSLSTEDRVVVQIKIGRVSRSRSREPARRVELADQPLYPGFSFGIVPLNNPDPAVSLFDICTLLESKWLVSCDVLPPLALDERPFLNQQREQYDADRILDELDRRYPLGPRGQRFIVAVTGRDIFGPDTNYVFSWQDRGRRIGVVSTYRFVAELDELYERTTIATRRLGIQFISMTGWLLGFTRPTKPDCPMAYPHDFREFLMKGSRLCESEVQQRDALLRRAGGTPTRFGTAKNDEINRVYRRYHFD